MIVDEESETLQTVRENKLKTLKEIQNRIKWQTKPESNRVGKIKSQGITNGVDVYIGFYYYSRATGRQQYLKTKSQQVVFD